MGNFFYTSILPTVIFFQLLIEEIHFPLLGLDLEYPLKMRNDYDSVIFFETKTSVREIINWRVTVNV